MVSSSPLYFLSAWRIVEVWLKLIGSDVEGFRLGKSNCPFQLLKNKYNNHMIKHVLTTINFKITCFQLPLTCYQLPT